MRILIADDDSVARLFLKTLLEKLGSPGARSRGRGSSVGHASRRRRPSALTGLLLEIETAGRRQRRRRFRSVVASA